MYTHILTYGMQSIQVFPPNFPNIFSFVQTISLSERRQQNLVLQKILLPSVWRIHICLEVFHQNTKDISYNPKIFIILKRGLPSFITLMASEVGKQLITFAKKKILHNSLCTYLIQLPYYFNSHNIFKEYLCILILQKAFSILLMHYCIRR